MLLSLRARLLLWLLLPLALFVFVTDYMSYVAACQTADLLQDAALLSSARTIIEDVDWENGALTANIPPAALEIFESPYQDHVFYKVVSGRDRLLGGSPDLTLPRAAPDTRCSTTPGWAICRFARWPMSGSCTIRAKPSRSR